ncbi:O-antigen ligase family protein [Desulfovulcanus sp.]
MGKIILYAILLGGGTAALLRPWIGVCLAYLFIILTPHNIWWWNFEGVRPVRWILIPTIIGFIIALSEGKANLDLIKNKRNLYLLTLWLCFVLSYFWGPYIGLSSPYWFHDPKWTFSLVNKIFFLYFIACICIDDERKLKYMMLVMIISVVYLIYWTNAQYLISHRYGRIGGPTGKYGGGVYSDQNAFAMLFVTGLPLIYYLGWYLKNKFLKYALWLIIPFGWHAIFLTGSRGGLLGAGATILTVAFRSPQKLIGLIIIPLFIVAYVWQAGSVMKERAATISQYEQESSAESRINAWKAAMKMIAEHPFVGVGLSAFGAAFQDFSDRKPREAHNTFFQIAAESGLVAGLMYMLVLWRNVADLLRNSRIIIAENPAKKNDFLYFANEALLASIIGFATCATFLSLQVYEIFYFLCMLINSATYLSMKRGMKLV